jgi:hypothetical protein
MANCDGEPSMPTCRIKICSPNFISFIFKKDTSSTLFRNKHLKLDLKKKQN